MALSELQKRVVERIDSNELAALATAMGNVTAPAGCEQAMADFVLDWLKSNGFAHSFQQNVAPGRSNTIGILKGRWSYLQEMRIQFRTQHDAELLVKWMKNGTTPTGLTMASSATRGL